MFTTEADVQRFRRRCEAVVGRGLSRPILAEALRAGPYWLDEFEKMSDADLAAFSDLWARREALVAMAARA